MTCLRFSTDRCTSPPAKGRPARNDPDLWHPECYEATHLEQMAWNGPYGIVPGGVLADPMPSWEPVYRIRKDAP